MAVSAVGNNGNISFFRRGFGVGLSMFGRSSSPLVSCDAPSMSVDLVVLVSLNSKGAGQVLKVTLTVVVGLFFLVVILRRLLMLLVALDRCLVKSVISTDT